MEIFEQQGAELMLEPTVFKQKLLEIKAIISDWDGVFNRGEKNPDSPSPYAEADSMGTNLLRYALWQRQEEMPFFGIITGADNPTARMLAKRERFQAVYAQIKDKGAALKHFCKIQGIAPHQVACFYDDANDLGMAQLCGLRFLVKRKASTAFTSFVKSKQLADYITAQEGGNYAVREICEAIMVNLGAYEQVLEARMQIHENYRDYLALRQQGKPQFFREQAGQILEVTDAL